MLPGHELLSNAATIHHFPASSFGSQREIISLFNRGDISVLLSTTTITEGINTTAKNVIVMSDMKGTKFLKHFDAQNIAGRAGRFNSHYSGRVIAVDNKFMTMLLEEGECLTHRGYDITSRKTDVDLEISHKDYLTSEEKSRKADIAQMVSESGLGYAEAVTRDSINDEEIEDLEVIPNLDDSVLEKGKTYKVKTNKKGKAVFNKMSTAFFVY